MLKDFYKAFGINETIEKEQARFVQRINQTIFKSIQKEETSSYDEKFEYGNVFTTICYWLGVNADDRISKATGFSYTKVIPKLRSLTDDNFIETIKILTLLCNYFDKKQKTKDLIFKWIKIAFQNAAIDLEIAWENGRFVPRGAEILDEKLLTEPFMWLDKYPDEKKDFEKAVTCFLEKKMDQVIINCYLTIEGLARTVLGNNKVLDNNRDDLVKTIGVSQDWKSILSNFIKYANEFKRHASKNRHDINVSEVEAFLYLTGLLVRLIIKTEAGRAQGDKPNPLNTPYGP